MRHAKDAGLPWPGLKRTLIKTLLPALLYAAAPLSSAAIRMQAGAEQLLRFDRDLERVDLSGEAVLESRVEGGELRLRSLAPGRARVTFVLSGDPAGRSFEVIVAGPATATPPSPRPEPAAESRPTAAVSEGAVLPVEPAVAEPVVRDPAPVAPAHRAPSLGEGPTPPAGKPAPPMSRHLLPETVPPQPAVPTATEAAAPDDGLPGAVARGLARHPELAARRSAYARAQTEVEIARDGYLPALQLSLGQEDGSSGGEPGFDILVSQMLYDWGLVGSEVDSALANQRQRNAEILIARNDIALDIAGVYLDVLFARQRIAAVDAFRARLERIEGLVRDRALGGYSDVSEQDRMALATAYADEQLDIRQGELERARRDFRLLVGSALDDQELPPYRSSASLFASEAALDRLLERSPVYLQAAEAVLAAQAGVDGASAALKPRLVLEGNSYRRQADDGVEEDSVIALRARMNFQGLAEFRRVSAERQGLESARFQLASTRRDLRRNVQGYLEEERALGRALSAIETQRREVTAVRDTYFDQFRVGYRDIEDLIGIEQEAFKIGVQAIDTASRRYRLAYRLSAELGVLEAFIGSGTENSTSD